MTTVRVLALCLIVVLCLASHAAANAVNIWQGQRYIPPHNCRNHDMCDGTYITTTSAEFYDNEGRSIGRTDGFSGNGYHCAGGMCVSGVDDLWDCNQGGESDDVKSHQIDAWFNGQYQKMTLHHQWYCNDNNLYMQFL
ncbi:hypothetical protein RI367_006438 [Sorochytrium milnesiophthora]